VAFELEFDLNTSANGKKKSKRSKSHFPLAAIRITHEPDDLK
jgi:hypothetical protein